MKYSDLDTAASAELTRLALQKIAQNSAKLNPYTFAVWYEHLAGVNPALDQAINDFQSRNKPIDYSDIMALYRRHVCECNMDVQELLREKTQHVLNDIKQQTQETSTQANEYDTHLQHSVEIMDGEQSLPPEIQAMIDDLRQQTLIMQQSIRSLNRHLNSSQGEIEALQQQLQQARSQAITDPLTGLLNRRGFEMRTEQILEAAHPQKPMTAIMLDIDHFKRVNDTYGHLFGDKVIKTLADVVKTQVGNQGIAARLGGEEFGVLLPNASLETASAIAENIRRAMENGKINRKQKPDSLTTVTVSLGIAQRLPDENCICLLDRADQALYRSKQNGRNQVSHAANEIEPLFDNPA